MRSRRPRRLTPSGYRRFGFRRGFFLGCLLGAFLSRPWNRRQRKRSDRRRLSHGRSAWPWAGGGAGAERTRGAGPGFGALAAFTLVPLVAFVIAALGIAILVARRVFAELTPRDRLLLN